MVRRSLIKNVTVFNRFGGLLVHNFASDWRHAEVFLGTKSAEAIVWDAKNVFLERYRMCFFVYVCGCVVFIFGIHHFNTVVKPILGVALPNCIG